jgi:hypothetical protein
MVQKEKSFMLEVPAVQRMARMKEIPGGYLDKDADSVGGADR